MAEVGSRAVPAGSPSAGITATVTPVPTATPTYWPPPTPEPRFTPTPALPLVSNALRQPEAYCLNLICVAVTAESVMHPLLHSPRDVVVARDGLTVYVTAEAGRSDDGGISEGFQGCGQDKPGQLPRSFVYRLRDQQLTILNIDGNYAHSCQFYGEIERDDSGDLILAAPDVDTDLHASFTAITAAKFVRVSPETGSVTQQGRLELGKYLPAPWPQQLYSDYFIPHALSHLRFTPYGLYYLLSDLSHESTQLDVFQFQRTASSVTGPGYHSQPVSFAMLSPEAVAWSLSGVFYGLPRSINEREPDAPAYRKDNTTGKCRLEQAYRMRAYSRRIYFSDRQNHAIGYLEDETLNCLAGAGEAGYQDGPGSTARFSSPAEIDVDAAGNLYVADTGNDAIRKITPEGMVSTLYREDRR
ncbi:MAG: hypothetical protein ACAI44_08525 [Candidatus Sericytochromatia bacterium]